MTTLKLLIAECTMRALAGIVLLVAGVATGAETPSGTEILALVDKASVAENRIIEAEMTIHTRRESRTIGLKSWIRGENESFSEYLSPPREAGTKMLKLGGELWTYTPSSDRIIKISGHMLRQSVMGSDLSYEDMMEDRELSDIYDAEVTGEDNVLERPCWVLTLTASVPDIAYFTRELWVDQARNIVLRENRYGKSGTLLKTTEVLEVERRDGRWVATRAVFKDALKSGDGTEFSISSIEFDTDIPDYIFSKAALKE
jgi:outer membrane lipoprotein-sorting protein